MKIWFTKKQNKTKQKDQKKKKKSFKWQELDPRPLTWKVNWLPIAPWQLIIQTAVKLIIFNTFAHEILLVDTVWSW